MQRLPRDRRMVAKEDLDVPGARRFSVAEAVDAIDAGRPLLYLRFSDGELHSTFGSGRWSKNTDKCRWLPDTLGEDLRACLEWAVAEAARGAPVRIELARCWNQWLAMREWIAGLPEAARACFSVGQIWPDALQSGSIYPLLESLRRVQLSKVVLAESVHQPFADAIGAVVIACPRPDAYLALDAIVPAAQQALGGRRGIVLASVGMASEPALRRLWDGRSVILDMGHVPDALTGIRVRRDYLRDKRLRRRIEERFIQWSRNER